MTKNVLALYKIGALALRRSFPGIGAGRGARPRCIYEETKEITNLSGAAHRKRTTGEQSRRRTTAACSHHILFINHRKSTIFSSPTQPRGPERRDSTSPLHRGWRTKERTGDSTGSKSANEIHRSAQRSTNLRLPTRAGNVSAKGGSVCTCIVSKQQYGGPLALRLSMGCRASCLFAAGARRDHILSRRLRVAHDRKMIRSFAQNPVRSLQSDVQKFPDRVTSHFGSDYDSIINDLGMNGN